MNLTPEQQELLEDYSRWLEKHGYLDSDWWVEELTAIDAYQKDISRPLKDIPK